MVRVLKAAVQEDQRFWNAISSTISLQLRSVIISIAEHNLGATEIFTTFEVIEEQASEQLKCSAMNCLNIFAVRDDSIF